MSHYQSYLKAIQKDKQETPSPASSVHRKPTPTWQPGPSTPSSTHNHVTAPSSVNSIPYTPASTGLPSSKPPSYTHSQPLRSHKPISPSASPAPPPAPTPASPLEQARKTLTREQVSRALETCLALQLNATTYHGKRPFAALLLAPDYSSVLLTHFSISHIRHAEAELARLASDHFSQSYLSHCTLVSTWEPCAMCSGTIYWSGIRGVLYAASEEKLKNLTGEGNEENMTMSLPCRKVLHAGQREIDVIGPVLEWEEKVVVESRKWWKEHLGGESGAASKVPSIRENGTGHTPGESGSIATTWTGEDSVLSSIGEDGEYKADLDIDWMR